MCLAVPLANEASAGSEADGAQSAEIRLFCFDKLTKLFRLPLPPPRIAALTGLVARVLGWPAVADFVISVGLVVISMQTKWIAPSAAWRRKGRRKCARGSA